RQKVAGAARGIGRDHGDRPVGIGLLGQRREAEQECENKSRNATHVLPPGPVAAMLVQSTRLYQHHDGRRLASMQIERPHPKIGALVTGVDVRSLSEADWQTLYRTWLDSIVMIVRGQT